jgi:hypothetical protein
MSQLFSLDGQKAGAERHASAQVDDFRRISVSCDGHIVLAKNLNDAIRIARDYVGELIHNAGGGIPWGVRVTVPDGTAVYGEWPLMPGGGGGSPSFQDTPLVKIRNRWHGSSPLSALENAIEIIKAYAPRFRDAA